MRGAPVIAFLILAGCAAAPPTVDPTSPPAVAPAVAILPGHGGLAAEPSVAVSARGVWTVAHMEQAPDGIWGIVVERSVHEGASWSAAPLPPAVVAAFDPAARFNSFGDPVLAATPDGRLHLAALASTQAVAGPATQFHDLSLFVTTSPDGGATWGPASFWQAGAGTFGFPVLFAGILQDKPWLMAAPDGSLHLAWTTWLEAQQVLHYARSPDGNTWTDPVRIAVGLPDRILFGASVAAAGDSVQVAIARFPPSQGERRPEPGGELLLWSSHDRGQTFAGPQVLGPATWDRYPALALDPQRPASLLVASPEDADVSRVYVRTSHDAGATWSDALWLAPGRSGPQTRPAACFMPDGTARVAFLDDSWPDGPALVVATLDGARVVDSQAFAQPAMAPEAARREYIGLHCGPPTLAAWVVQAERPAIAVVELQGSA